MTRQLAVFFLWWSLSAGAAQFEKQSVALKKLLGPGQILKKTVALKDSELDRKIAGSFHHELYYARRDGSATAMAIVEKRIYEPNCSHTWVVGINPKSFAVTEVRVVEMSCPHAFPCKENSFLDQYKGVGPAQLEKLRGQVDTIAKATGTSQLTTDVVVTAVKVAQAAKVK